MNLSLNIAWLYPELMSTYGDRGNIMTLKWRCEQRGISVSVEDLDIASSAEILKDADLIFGGGAQDRQQGIVVSDLIGEKSEILKKKIEEGTPGLFICGSLQLLGHSYIGGDGQSLEGLGVLDLHTRHFGKNKPRCIGNVVAEALIPLPEGVDRQIVGFENHGGRTYLGKNVSPLAKVLKGFGNNGEDGTEGAVFKNCMATYFHGSFLPKNPHIADYLISKALERKYQEKIELKPINDVLEWRAHDFLVQRELNLTK